VVSGKYMLYIVYSGEANNFDSHSPEAKGLRGMLV
jgi:hypothetical protein